METFSSGGSGKNAPAPPKQTSQTTITTASLTDALMLGHLQVHIGSPRSRTVSGTAASYGRSSDVVRLFSTGRPVGAATVGLEDDLSKLFAVVAAA
jgi:hypothetical protein